MIKLAKIGLIMLLLVAIGSPVNGHASEKQIEPVKYPTGLSEPQKVVWDYFAAYIAWLDYDLNKGDGKVKTIKPVPNRSLDPNYVTRHYIDSYNKLMQEDKKTTPPGEVGFLDYDPIICGQDFPDNMDSASVVLVNNIGTEATVKVGFSQFTVDSPRIIKLKKLPEGWRIDAILCGKDDFDSMYETIKKKYKQQKK
ncbi:MAG: YqhG/Tai3 family protein [Desulfobaccales bacterium]